jgi:hypothetical protein
MEATEGNALDLLREMVRSLVPECTDEDLLDLIYRLLAQSSGVPG